MNTKTSLSAQTHQGINCSMFARTFLNTVFISLRGAYAVSQTTVLHMKRLNQTESPIFVIVCVLCFQRQSFFLFLFYENTERPGEDCVGSSKPLHTELGSAQSVIDKRCLIWEPKMMYNFISPPSSYHFLLPIKTITTRIH